MFVPAQGGAAAGGPTYDCADAVPAVISDDLTAATFDVSSFQAGRSVAVAIVPSTTDSVVFAAPGDDALGTTADSTSDDGSAPVAPPPSASTVGPGPATRPAVVQAPALAPAPHTATKAASAPIASPAPNPIAPASPASAARAVVLAGLCALGAAAWTSSRRLAAGRAPAVGAASAPVGAP